MNWKVFAKTLAWSAGMAGIQAGFGMLVAGIPPKQAALGSLSAAGMAAALYLKTSPLTQVEMPDFLRDEVVAAAVRLQNADTLIHPEYPREIAKKVAMDELNTAVDKFTSAAPAQTETPKQ